ncbi:Chromatin structure-remodeling complex protein rsc9 [Recurvomyces mirabilis]|uniref:Chromatin structure-remodeling complex protein rsc9 n=1 Tax=Recurvomyces mirabilis TaxID=574656 RepID=A0AAE0WUR9_9PEZI|nr:Chromatin structure-remodeling complex protein rsc9 [Recurvomyces mirabilis]KAK5156756.1 Chromatin structure-remodeling complex protein rsc9 [Recurvomyces mirabilis]
MAPKRGESIEKTDEHEDFVKKLAEYHEKRGTTLETEPKVGVRHIDLFKLYTRVVDEGGYDLCSDTKAKPLMWRRFAEEFVGKNVYTAAQAFQIKNVYYKNLVAYEITKHWQKEPPPKEILEEVTAKGGNVMTRTVENFAKPVSKEEVNLGNKEEEESPEQQKTPKIETTEGADDPGSATGRTTRLRQAPPQRVLFQPDLTSGRQVRGGQNTTTSPTPGLNGFPPGNMSLAASSTLASYEPAQSYPLSLKPVTTPANNPEHYRQAAKRKAETMNGPAPKKYRNIMLPGTGFIGPNIYLRAQYALQSGIESEETYALHHLVKISHERGDKYRFDQFPGLAEALVKKCVSVAGLFYDVEWEVCYEDEMMDQDEETLDGLRGTSDIVQRLNNMTLKVTEDGMLDPAFSSQLNRVMEAALVIRNMVLQHENAKYMVSIPTVRDYLTVALNLPQHPAIVELQHYALDTAEQLLVWCDLGPKDGLYQALVAQLYGQDRGAITSALRTIARIAMNLPGPKRLDEVPDAILRKVQAWLLVEDEELKTACLDFLFQYTSFANNVATLLSTLDAPALTHHLSRLLLYGVQEKRDPKPERKTDDCPASSDNPNKTHPIPRLSRSVVLDLLQLDEPDRSSEWLRMLFLASPTSDMTQISLWQAYQSTFAPHSATHPHLVAGEFIKNVSATFVGATAQVALGNKYVIKGICARKEPVEAGGLVGCGKERKGRGLGRCRWGVREAVMGQQMQGAGVRMVECGEFFREGEAMGVHVLEEHLGIPVKADASNGGEMDIDSHGTTTNGTGPPKTAAATTKFDFANAPLSMDYTCRWATCHHHPLSPPSTFSTSSSSSLGSSNASTTALKTSLFARHIFTHLPDSDSRHGKNNISLSPDATVGERSATGGKVGRVRYEGLVDEKGDAFGVPLGAVLVLRNLAKFLPGDSAASSSSGTTNFAASSAGAELGLEGRDGGGAVSAATAGANGCGHTDQKNGSGSLMDRVFDHEVVEGLMTGLTKGGKGLAPYVGGVLGFVRRRAE